MINVTKKRIFSLVGTIFLGAIGSGLWSVAFEPFFSSIGRKIIYLGSFGINTVRNSFYIDISKGHHDQSSLLILTTMLFFGSFITGYSAPVKEPTPEELEKHRNKILSKELGSNEIAEDICIYDAINRYSHKFKFKVFLFYVFLFSIFSFKFISNSYVNKIITNFNQSYNICRPYMQ